MLSWDDLRVVLAVARAGSLKDAARSLKVAHSTVFRRLAAVEAAVGARLFDRLPGGAYVLTDDGEKAAVIAERIETEVAALDRELLSRDSRITGKLRVTSSETLAFSVLTTEVAKFRQTFPGITIEITIDNRILSLSRRETDVALRATRPVEQSLYGRKLADVAWTIYGSATLLRETEEEWATGVLKSSNFIGWESGITGVNAAAWISGQIPAERIVYRSNSIVNQMMAARAGVGLAVLPCYLGDRESALLRAIRAPIPELARELWIITHADLKGTARVKAFLDFVGGAIIAQRALLDGTAPT